jgi:hypothetical protein
MKGELKLCPQCGSASVDFSELAGGAARCRGCRWSGYNTELVVMPFEHEFLADESMAVSMVNDMRLLLSGPQGVPYLKFLMKWGFLVGKENDIAGTVDRKKFARYLTAISKGILTSVLEERARQDIPHEELC